MDRTQRGLLAGIIAATLIALAVVIVTLAVGGRADPPRLRAATSNLDGAWRFRIGDDLRWANANTDDRGWETMDLSAPPGSHDADVGLPGYVGGWMSHGHPGYRGYAWYRRMVTVPSGNRAWDLLGPTAVDDGYELYWNGARLGGSGRLGAAPRVVGTRPMLFALPADAPGTRGVLAIRTYMQPGNDASADGGGMHIAPLLAPRPESHALYRVQWWRTIAGYIVDLIEPIAMFALAGLGLMFRRRSSHPGFLALAGIALVLSALKRLENPTYAWTDLLSLPAYVWWMNALLAPLGMAAWALAWNRWCPRAWRTIDVAALALAVAGVAGGAMHVTALTHVSRLGLLALLVLIAMRMVRDGPMRVTALATMAWVLIAQFPDELSAIGIPGIWFPLGIGVSRTQYAYAVAIPLLAVLIVRTLSSNRMQRWPAALPGAPVRR
ncbi:glycoside hydrolase family 2 [Rhodanobacter glycinis]|uniref:Glycoside hydrolase family 2 n=1 Tax=Rhodanobacter glycinis TaxID=582702 RepID=A0A502CE77_9GAMM|nr:glycoside hydrolase family 2 [Rhodanobacter glycinis]TPG10992.1 glycoside hydrolase family 2 [Rhodanobacter glycinis]TPG48480.1 glycoside hydrolase family 2 [Rhodanobacter glycinis]